MERRAGKKKLSKNLLEMKIMKRTKEKTELEEEVRARMFEGEVSGAMRQGAGRIMVEPSYVNIENLRFGRLAFKGMNAEIESMMAEHTAALASEDKEADVDDAEMASRLSQSIAKKFATKRDKTGKPAITKNLASHSAETNSILAQTSTFLSQVRAETDLKKSKPNFLKPPE